MYIPLEAYSAKITDFQFRLFAILCRLAGPGGLIQTSVAQLCVETGKSSDKTVRSALQGLEEAGLIYTEATKRANGYRPLKGNRTCRCGVCQQGQAAWTCRNTTVGDRSSYKDAIIATIRNGAAR